MSIFTIPPTQNVCDILSGMKDKEIVFPTDEADWKAWSACDVGAKVAALAPVVSENYEYAVIDQSDLCVKRAAKPVKPATYDSNLLAPWTGYVRWEGALTGGGTPDNHPEFNIPLPEFTTDVYILASWTLARNDSADFTWYPKGPSGVGYVAQTRTLQMTYTTNFYSARSVARRVLVTANTAGLKLGIWHNSTSGTGYVRVSAVAFKV